MFSKIHSDSRRAWWKHLKRWLLHTLSSLNSIPWWVVSPKVTVRLPGLLSLTLPYQKIQILSDPLQGDELHCVTLGTDASPHTVPCFIDTLTPASSTVFSGTQADFTTKAPGWVFFEVPSDPSPATIIPVSSTS
jgi:hypothetical protein